MADSSSLIGQIIPIITSSNASGGGGKGMATARINLVVALTTPLRRESAL
jgi:hypothetical protein